MKIRVLATAAAAFACISILASAPAAAAARRVLVLNAGDQPIFTLRIGHAEQNAWGPDLLPFNDVVDVSRGRDVTINVDENACMNDVSATLGDGTTIVLRDVDLCTVTELRFAP